MMTVGILDVEFIDIIDQSNSTTLVSAIFLRKFNNDEGISPEPGK